MSNDIMQKPPEQSGGLSSWIENDRVVDRIASALGDIMDAKMFLMHMMSEFQVTPEIRACTDLSKYRAMMKCAVMGVLPTADQVSLVPYENKKEGTIECEATIQWQGLKAIMERHPAILEICVELVHIGDQFACENGVIQHSYNPFDDKRNINTAADIVGGYARIIYTDGRPPKYHTMPVKEISKNQACAKTQRVWVRWYKQMAMKTVYRDCYSRRAIPVDPVASARLEQVLKIEDAQLGNDPMRVPEHKEQSGLDDVGALFGPADKPEPESEPEPTQTKKPAKKAKSAKLPEAWAESLDAANTVDHCESLSLDAADPNSGLTGPEREAVVNACTTKAKEIQQAQPAAQGDFLGDDKQVTHSEGG